jgi:hypothetical protein
MCCSCAAMGCTMFFRIARSGGHPDRGRQRGGSAGHFLPPPPVNSSSSPGGDPAPEPKRAIPGPPPPRHLPRRPPRRRPRRPGRRPGAAPGRRPVAAPADAPARTESRKSSRGRTARLTPRAMGPPTPRRHPPARRGHGWEGGEKRLPAAVNSTSPMRRVEPLGRGSSARDAVHSAVWRDGVDVAARPRRDGCRGGPRCARPRSGAVAR